MGDDTLIEALLEVPHELRAVVGEQIFWWFQQQFAERIEGDGGVSAGLGGGAKAMKRLVMSMKVNR